MPDDFKSGWNDDSDSEASDTEVSRPQFLNPEAELARTLDLARIWEPASLKVVETPFTIANRQRQVNEAAAAAALKGRGKDKSTKKSTGTIGELVTFLPGVNNNHQSQPIPGPSRSKITNNIAQVAPPPVIVKRRGPIPAKSGKLFGVTAEEEKKKKDYKKPYAKKWTKAEVDGWKDANGNPIPSSKSTGGKGKKGAGGKQQRSILDMLDNPSPEEKVKGKGKGRGKKVVKSGEDEEDIPVPEKVKGKKKAQPKKKKKVEDDSDKDEEEAEMIVKKVKAVTRKKKTVVVVESESESEMEKPLVVDSDDDEEGDEDSLLDMIIGRKRGFGKKGDTIDGPPKKKIKKAEPVTKGKGKGKVKAKGDEEQISFGRIPADAEPSDEFPILQLLENQKSLPTKPKTTKTKPKTKAKSKVKPKSKAVISKSPSLPPDDTEADAFIKSLQNLGRGGVRTIDELFPESLSVRNRPRKKAVSEDGGGAGSIDPEGTEGSENERVNIGGDDGEEEGKKGLLSRYFSQADGVNGSQTAPTTLVGTPTKSHHLDPPTITKLDIDPADTSQAVQDTSSAFPEHSSPTENRNLRRQDSNLIHPQPVRQIPIPLPNADKFERLAKIAAKTREGEEKRQNSKAAVDVSSYMRTGYTQAKPPMSGTRRRGRSPQPQIDSRFRGPTLNPSKPEINDAMFRSPAYRPPPEKKPPIDIATNVENNVNGGEWSTLGQKANRKRALDILSQPNSTSYTHNHQSSSSLQYGTRGDDTSTAKSTTQLNRRANLFTPQAPKITVPIPKFTSSKKNAGTGQYGSAASTRTEEAMLDPYARAKKEEMTDLGFGRKGYRKDSQYGAESPVEEELRGKYGVYAIQKGEVGRDGVRPRYMPANVVGLGPAPVGRTGLYGDREADGDGWKDQWKLATKKELGKSMIPPVNRPPHESVGRNGQESVDNYGGYGPNSSASDFQRNHRSVSSEHQETAGQRNGRFDRQFPNDCPTRYKDDYDQPFPPPFLPRSKGNHRMAPAAGQVRSASANVREGPYPPHNDMTGQPASNLNDNQFRPSSAQYATNPSGNRGNLFNIPTSGYQGGSKERTGSNNSISQPPTRTTSFGRLAPTHINPLGSGHIRVGSALGSNSRRDIGSMRNYEIGEAGPSRHKGQLEGYEKDENGGKRRGGDGMNGYNGLGSQSYGGNGGGFGQSGYQEGSSMVYGETGRKWEKGRA